MPPHHHDRIVKVSGEVTELFVHRFVLKTKAKSVLADLAPHGAAIVKLRVGDQVAIEGEQKPSEIKVFTLRRDDHTYVIAHVGKPHEKHGPPPHEHEPADPAVALKAAKSAGFRVVGEARRKPKHFEVLGKKGRSYQELHIELDGEIRKAKPVPFDDHKWRDEIEGSRAH